MSLTNFVSFSCAFTAKRFGYITEKKQKEEEQYAAEKSRNAEDKQKEKERIAIKAVEKARIAEEKRKEENELLRKRLELQRKSGRMRSELLSGSKLLKRLELRQRSGRMRSESLLGSKLRKRLELQRRKKRRGVNCCLKARIAAEKRKEEERIAIKVANSRVKAEEPNSASETWCDYSSVYFFWQ